MKLQDLFTQFTDNETQFFIKASFGANVIGLLASWLANNWYILGGFVVASVVPMIMSWQKHREQLRHMKVMDELEEQKAKEALHDKEETKN